MVEKKREEGEKLIASNPAARSNYFIDELIEAGMVLTGTEVKSLRSTAPNLRDAFVEVRSQGGKFEAWLLNANFAPYSHGNIWNHEATRKRKLLLHTHQLEKMYGAIIHKGLSVFPTRMYFTKGIAKVELGIGKGKKKGDKRQDQKKKTAQREIDQVMKKSRSR